MPEQYRLNFTTEYDWCKTGFGVAKWLVDEDVYADLTYITRDFKFFCHSANPVGKKNIEDLLNDYIRRKFSGIR